MPRRGAVWLVGAGPGDPELLTLKALRRMRAADVVLHDRLVSPEILDLVPAATPRIDVGKAPGGHAMPQAEITARMIALAEAGQRVLRLKGGDPFLFGRGGEEIEAVIARGLPVEVVPGITAATGCAAAAGIPLTHRDHAQACVFVTGHTKDGRLDLDWPALARPRQTLVVYMGLASLGRIAERLVAHGLDPATPAALIARGTRAGERVLTASLAALPDAARRARIDGPALIVVGEVVALSPAAVTEATLAAVTG